MMDPVTASTILLGSYRLAGFTQQVASRRSAEREQRRLAECAGCLPAGGELGEVRADGSHWWIRIPAPAA